MTDLTFEGGNNPGGNCVLRFAPVAGIASIASPLTQPVFRTGYRWFDAYGSEGTKEVDETQDETDNGPTWNVKISLFLPGDSVQRRGALAELVRHRFILEVQDNAGLYRRIGTLTECLQFSYSFRTGGAMAQRRGAQLTFRGTLSTQPPIRPA